MARWLILGICAATVAGCNFTPAQRAAFATWQPQPAYAPDMTLPPMTHYTLPIPNPQPMPALNLPTFGASPKTNCNYASAVTFCM